MPAFNDGVKPFFNGLQQMYGGEGGENQALSILRDILGSLLVGIPGTSCTIIIILFRGLYGNHMWGGGSDPTLSSGNNYADWLELNMSTLPSP